MTKRTQQTAIHWLLLLTLLVGWWQSCCARGQIDIVTDAGGANHHVMMAEQAAQHDCCPPVDNDECQEITDHCQLVEREQALEQGDDTLVPHDPPDLPALAQVQWPAAAPRLYSTNPSLAYLPNRQRDSYRYYGRYLE